MSNLTGKERAQYVQGMFTRIAHRYDFMNKLMTGAQDIRWRKEVIRLAQIKPSASSSRRCHSRPRNGYRRFGTRGAKAESTNPRDLRRLHA